MPEDPAKLKFRDILFFMVFFALMGAGSLLYLVRRINWLLIEKDEELRYRSMKVGDNDIFKRQSSSAVKFKGKQQAKKGSEKKAVE